MGLVNLINGGLDIQGIVDNLIYVAREPIRRLEQQTKAFKDKITAYQSFNTKLLAFKTSIEGIMYPGTTPLLSIPAGFEERLQKSMFALRTAESSDETVLTATAGKGTVVGNYAVTVSSLAQSDSYASTNFASDTATLTQTGTLVIQKGTAEAVTITIDETNNTLRGIRDAINAADAGFTASIIRDGSASPYRLAITSDDSGTANALTITNNLNQGAGQAVTLTQTVAAQDAALQINGIDIVSGSNAVTDAIEGVTLNLKSATGSAVVAVQRDVDAMVAALKDFAAKYNEVVSYISSQFRFDTTTQRSGVLSGDYMLRDAQGKLSATLAQTISSDESTLKVLAQIGFKTANDGTISLDETKLKQSLSSDFRGVARVMLADGVDQAANTISIMPQLYSRLKSLTDPLAGPVFRAQDSVQQSITRINRQIREMEERLEVRRDLLIAQFSQADQALRQLSVIQTSLAAQISSLSALR